MDKSLFKYCKYLENAGGFITVEHFDDDWSPIGERVRNQLIRLDLAEYKDAYGTRFICIKLTPTNQYLKNE